MPRSEEVFAATWKDLQWSVKHHRKPFWLVPMKDGYRVSSVKPDAQSLPFGTTANLYDPDLTIIDSVGSTQSM